jgi:hypothetical protein
MAVSEELRANVFEEGTRTGNWFAMGEMARDPSAELPLRDERQVSTVRRRTVRVIGCLLIGGTLACVVRLATHAPARQAILKWGFFGQSERILPSSTRW